MFLSKQPESILTTVNFFETGVDEQSGIILKNTHDEMPLWLFQCEQNSLNEV